MAKLVTLIINVEDTRLSVALSTPQSLVVAKPNLSWQILYLVPPAVCFVSFQPVFPNQGHKGIQAMGAKRSCPGDELYLVYGYGAWRSG